MKVFFKFLFAFLVLSFNLLAQNTDKQPIKWHVSINKIDDFKYEFVAEAEIDAGYHIWALDAGGDGSFINTEINVEDGDIIWLEESWQASKSPKSEKDEELYGGTVYFYEKGVKFKKRFSLNKNVDKIEGSISYQMCNHQMCLPPTDLDFVTTIPTK